MKSILITGPRIDGISGGQATHMRNLANFASHLKGFQLKEFQFELLEPVG